MNVFADDAVRFFGGEGDVTGYLPVVMRDTLGAKAEGSRIGVAGLCFEARPVDGAAGETRWSSSLEPATTEAELFQSFAEQNGVRFAGASGRVLLLAAVN